MLYRFATMFTVVLLAAGAVMLTGCDEGSNASTTTAPATSAAHDDHAGHDHSAHAHATAAPDFTLTDIAGKTHSLADFKGKWVVLEWINPECPFVKKFYSAGKMQEWQKAYTDKGVVWLSIASSASGKQGHYDAAKWQTLAADQGFNASAVLLDADGAVGHLYDAKTTPHMFVINPEGNIAYQGAIDSKKSTDATDIATATNYVAAALDAGMAGNAIEVASSEPYGCNVKY